MSRAKYPNRDALREAHDIYLDAIYPFVSKCLDKFQDTTAEKLIRNALSLASHDNIAEKIEISDIAHLVRTYWYDYFEDQFEAIDPHYEARSAIGLIVEGRNRASHRPWDLDPEFTRTQLFLIAEVLGKISRSDAQSEVEDIRDKLFDDTTEHLVTVAVEDEKAKYEKSIAEVEKRLAVAEKNNKKLSKEVGDNAAELDKKTKELEKISEQFVGMKLSEKETKKQFNSITEQLEKEQTAHSACKERLTTTEAEKEGYKERFETTWKELEAAEREWQACEDGLAAMRNLFMTATIGKPEIQVIFPPIETDSTVRILDRRGVDKKNYLLALLEQKQPTIIYVQSEERIDQLLSLVGTEKAGMIGRHDEQTAEKEEVEFLKELENRELIAVVSNTTFSTLDPSHSVEHFVLCHLVPSLDEFFDQCEAAFISEKSNYLHLIYNKEQDVEGLNQWLTQKYPDEEALGALYRELKRLAETDEGFIKPENVYNENIYNKLGMAKLGVQTGLAIFEELQFLERNESGVKVLPDPEKRGLDESKIHCGGEALKQGIADAQAFQLKQSIEQIWEGLEEKLDVGSDQILYEGDVDRTNFRISETGDDPQSTEAVENDSEAGDGDTEASQTSEPTRANAKVTEEQVKEIRSRSTTGEANSELAEKDNEKKPEVKQSEFWQPIRDGEFGALFTGKPVPVGNDGHISKRIRGVEVILSFRKDCSYVSFLCKGENRIERRDEIIALFPEADYDYSPRESPQRAGFEFSVINKGKDHSEDWDEIREKLVAMGTDIYNKIDESAL